MCILITGGAGFIGSNIAVQLYKNNLNVAICDWLGQEDKWKNLQHIVPEDLIAPETLSSWLDQQGKIFPRSFIWALSAPQLKLMPI